MQVIKVKGSVNSGKTTSLIHIAAQHSIWGKKKVLYICHTEELASALKRKYLAEFGGQFMPVFSGPNLRTLRAFQYGVVILDQLELFPKSDEGCWLKLAKQRVECTPFSVVAYSQDITPIEYISECELSSMAVWYKPWTWLRGYWKQPGGK